MPDHTTEDIRNVALVGHAAGGKTTLVERLLFDAGAIGRMGTVEDGNTACDFEEEEKHHKHSLSSAVAHFAVDGKRFHVIDTPGAPDFIGLAISVLPAAETMFVVIDATKGIQTVTRRMMAIGQERRLARVIVVNKIDAVSPDRLDELLQQIRETFGNICLPANLPSGGCKSVVNVITSEEGSTDFWSVAEAHTAILDQIVEIDDSLMANYLETGTVEQGALHSAFEQSLCQAHLVPILFVSAREGTGCKELQRFLTDWCPSPTEGNPRPFLARAGDDAPEEEWSADAAAGKHAVAHVFKVSSDPFVGKLAFFRVHQGVVRANSQLQRNDEKKPVRIGHILRIRGKEHEEVDAAVPGDIVAVAKVEEIKLNDVLHEPSKHTGLHLRPLPMPTPMLGLAIETKTRGDEAKLSNAIHKLTDEDPTFVVERVATTHQTVARGLGDLHLRVMIEKIKNRFGVDVITAPPRVAYKETISAKAEGHHRHKKQTGGAGQFGEVFLRVEPLPNDHETGFEFVDATFGGSVPRQFLPAIEKGVRSVLTTGAVAGYPLTGVRVSVYDGKHHPVDSKEIAFMTAGKRAFIDAVSKARPVLLEPFVDVEVTAPNQFMGDLTSDLIAKRGRIAGTDVLPGDMCSIRAEAPLSEIMNYANQLKSITAGQGSFSMDYSHDEAAPPNVMADVVAQYKPHEEED